MAIALSSPDLTESERDAVLGVLGSPSLSLGPKLPEFERALCQVTSTRFAVAVNSGTSALHLCIKAARIRDGDEVITTPFSFVASANCVLFERGIPVFVDIDPVTYNIDPNLIERAITRRTRALLPVHVFGRPCRMDAILDIARRHDLVVIEDACEAIGATFQLRPVGAFGRTGVFAFYPNKQITTGEGGALVTDDEDTARRCRGWRNQGRAEHSAWLEHDCLGYNYRLSDINCALGIAQLRRLPEILSARARVAALYAEALSAVPEVLPPPLREEAAIISWFVYVVRLANRFTISERNAVIGKLRAAGIGCSPYFPPIHLQRFYRESFGFERGAFPVTEHVSDRTIALPFYNRLAGDEVSIVSRELAKAIRSLPRAASAGRGL